MENINLYLKNFRKSGDKGWFEKIYKYFMPKIYRFFYIKTLNKQLSEDLTSEVFIRVYKNFKKFHLNVNTFQAWIYRIAKNILIDHFRKKKKDIIESEIADDSIELIEDEYLIKNSTALKKELGFENYKLIDAMNKLTKLQKDVLLLKFVENFDYKTIADIYSKKQLTIRGIIFRALSKLKSEMA